MCHYFTIFNICCPVFQTEKPFQTATRREFLQQMHTAGPKSSSGADRKSSTVPGHLQMRSNWEVPGHCAPSERSPSDIPEKSLAQVSPKKHGLRHTSMLDSGTCEVAVTFPKHGTGITYSHPRSTNHHHEWMVFVDRSLGLTSIRSGTCWMLVSL